MKITRAQKARLCSIIATIIAVSAALLASISANANPDGSQPTNNSETRGLQKMKVNIMVDTWGDGRDKIYYECDYAKRVTKNILKKLGAQDIQVSCSGGFDTYSRMMPMPISLKTKFLALSQNGSGEFRTETRSFSLKYRDDCHLPSTVFNKLLPHFEATNIIQDNTCRTGRFARYSASGFAPQLVD